MALSMIGVGCSDDAEVGSGGESTGESGSSSTTDPVPTTTGVSTTVDPTTDPTTSPTTAPTTDPTTAPTTTEADSSSGGSSETGCTPGEADCTCDEGSCVDGLECTPQDVCEATAECEDDEYGDILTEETAHFLGEINDNDGNGGTVMGILTGPDDVDWFRYDGSDDFGNVVDPFRTIAADSGVRFCKFGSCMNGLENTEFSCGEDASATTSPDGLPGCCAEAVLPVDATCSGTISDDMAIWIRVDQAEEACVQYAFNYHF